MNDTRDMPGYERIIRLILKSIFGLVICIFLMYKLKDCKIEIKDFDYLYFLSTVIALFAIVLSILFYFKSTEQSNQFYNNIVTFIKDTSSLLVEMKSGIGHLENEVYRSSFSNIEGKCDAFLQRNELSEFEQKITDLIKNSGLSDQQSKELKDKILMQYDEYTKQEQDKVRNSVSKDMEEGVLGFLALTIRKRNRFTKDDMCFLPKSDLRIYADCITEIGNAELIRDGKATNIITEDKTISDEGLEKLQKYIKTHS